jgi:hypothetical protein
MSASRFGRATVATSTPLMMIEPDHRVPSMVLIVSNAWVPTRTPPARNTPASTRLRKTLMGPLLLVLKSVLTCSPNQFENHFGFRLGCSAAGAVPMGLTVLDPSFHLYLVTDSAAGSLPLRRLHRSNCLRICFHIFSGLINSTE